MNSSNQFVEKNIDNSAHIFERYEFLQSKSEVALPSLIVLILATITGTFGNVLILVCVLTSKRLRKVEGIFIVNLAASDLYVTLIADPMSILAKLEGEEFFDSLPGLCQTVASICTISCVTSMMTIAAMSCNRYIYICDHDRYEKIFTKWNSIAYCISFYLVGCILVLLNSADIGDHGFDRKSLECIWDRMATYPYTVIFSVTLVWIPSCVTGFCYLKIFMYVRKHKMRIRDQNQALLSGKSFHLARTLFILYAVFVTCWVPYAILIVVDYNDKFSHEIHVYLTVFAHLHPSLNWLIYLLTNKKFSDACKHMLNKCYCSVCRFDINEGTSGFTRDRDIVPSPKPSPSVNTAGNQRKTNSVSRVSRNISKIHPDENSNLDHSRKHSKVLETNC